MSFSAAAADERVLDVSFSDDALSVSLRDGRIITVPLVWYPRLLNATPAQRKNWKIAGGGYGIQWPDLDEDLSTEGLLRARPLRKQALPRSDCGLKVEIPPLQRTQGWGTRLSRAVTSAQRGFPCGPALAFAESLACCFQTIEPAPVGLLQLFR